MCLSTRHQTLTAPDQLAVALHGQNVGNIVKRLEKLYIIAVHLPCNGSYSSNGCYGSQGNGPYSSNGCYGSQGNGPYSSGCYGSQGYGRPLWTVLLTEDKAHILQSRSHPHQNNQNTGAVVL